MNPDRDQLIDNAPNVTRPDIRGYDSVVSKHISSNIFLNIIK